jgi:hypothetical protein
MIRPSRKFPLPWRERVIFPDGRKNEATTYAIVAANEAEVCRINASASDGLETARFICHMANAYRSIVWEIDTHRTERRRA